MKKSGHISFTSKRDDDKNRVRIVSVRKRKNWRKKDVRKRERETRKKRSRENREREEKKISNKTNK